MNDDDNQYTPYDPSADIAAALIFGAARSGDRVLEIGCGSGDDALFLAEAGCRVTAIDTSEICIDYAKSRCRWLRRLKSIRSQCDFSVGNHRNLMKLAKTDASFDLVSDRLVFCNLKEVGIGLSTRKKYLESIAHLIRDDGLFFLRMASPRIAAGSIIADDSIFTRGEAATLNALFRPASLGTEERRRSTMRRASLSGRWMSMFPIRGGYATAAAVFLLEARKR